MVIQFWQSWCLSVCTLSADHVDDSLKVIGDYNYNNCLKEFKISENMQRGDPWKIFENFQKYAKGGPLEKKNFEFFFNTSFHSEWSYETIRMPFEGVRMLNTP